MQYHNILYLLWGPLRLWHAMFPTREEQIVIPILSKRIPTSEQAIPFRDWRGICKPVPLLLSQGWLNPEEANAVGMFVLAKEKSGKKLNLRKFAQGEGKGKTSLELFEEIRKGEAEIRLRDDLRYLRSARRIRIFITDKTRTLHLHEIGRSYYRTQPKYVRKDYALSGCIQKGELSKIKRAARRETKEELNLDYEEDAFTVKSAPLKAGAEHESDAYYGGLSTNWDHDVELVIDPWPEEWFRTPPVIDDTSVKVFTGVERTPDQDNSKGATASVSLTPRESAGFESLRRIR